MRLDYLCRTEKAETEIKMRILRKSSTAGLVLLILGVYCASCTATAKECWIGTWVTAQHVTEERNNPPAPGLSNNTLRQVVHATLEGSKIRLQFSNEYGNSPVTIKAAHIAASKGGSAIDGGTDKAVTFKGAPSITIKAGEAVYSDTLDFEVKPLSNLAVSLYFGETSPAVTGHPGSRTTSYIQTGDAVTAADMASAVTTDHWYILSGIDLWLDDSYACVVKLGDLVSGGGGASTPRERRWA